MQNMKKLLIAAAAASIGSSALAASLDEPVFALAKMRTSPVVDGVIGADEWKDATKALQFIPRLGNVAFPGEAQVMFGRDAEKFYVAARMIVSPHGLVRGPDPVKRRGNGGDLKAFSGDCLELDFTSDKDALKETVSHIIVSSVGAYYSTGTENGLPVSWDPPNFKTASRVVDGYWEFEFSIPLSEIKFKDADAASHGVRIARDWKFLNANSFGIQSSVAPFETSFEKAGACCRMPFDDDAPVVRHEDLGISGHGGDRHFSDYPVRLTVSNTGGKPLDVKVKILGKPVNSQPVLVEMPATVAPGETKEFAANGAVLSDELVDLQLLVTSADGAKTYYSRRFRFQPNFEAIAWMPHDSKGPATEFRHAYYPSQDRMRVQAKFPGDKKNARGAKVTFTILDSKGRVVSRSEARADSDGVADAVIPTGDLAAETRASGCGDYRVVMAAAGVKDGVRTNEFWRNVFEWEDNKIGLSGKIPAPFTAVERVRDAATGEERVKTILREHAIGDFGLWKQVRAVGKDVLAAPVALESDASFDRSLLAAESEWDVDGMMKWTLTLKKGLKLAAPLRLVIPVRGERAPLMHSCTDGIRISYAGAVPKGEGVVWRSSQVPHVGIIGDYVPYIWVGGPLRGISVFGDNDKGWITADGVNHQEIVRDGDGTVRILLNLVQKPVEIAEDRTIVLGFQATPTKPMQEGWRSKSLGIFFGSGKCWGCGQTDSDVCPWDGTDEFWRKMREVMETGKIDEDFLKRTDAAYTYGGKPGSKEQAWWRERVVRHFRSGMLNCVRGRTKETYTWYTNARGVDFSTKQGQTFCDEWNRQEWMPHKFDILSHRDYDLDPCASFRDYAAWWYRKAISLGVCDNYYWDDIYLCPNYNLSGTDAYRLDDGTIQPSTGLFNMRALIRRCAMVQAECGKTRPNLNWLHMTSTAIAPILSFGGVNYDLEDGGSVNDFQDRYGRDYMLACTIGRQHGNIVSVMGYFGKTTPEEKKRLQRCGTGVMLVHELIWRLCPDWRTINEQLRKWGYRSPDVDVWNDWDEDVPFPVAITGEPVAALAMRNRVSGEAIVIVSDWAKGGVARVAPDAAALGLGAGFRAFDFETGDELTVSGGAVEARLALHDFRIIRFVPPSK